MFRLFNFQRVARFATKSSATGKSTKPTSSFTPLALLGVIALLGPGYFLLKPQVAKKLVLVDSVPIPKGDTDKNILRINGIPHVQYVLVGGGTASFAALEAIREREPFAKILIISAESYPPYQRPPLSKELWWPETALRKSAKPDDVSFVNWEQKESSLFYLPKESYSMVDQKALGKSLSKNTTKVHLLLETFVQAIDAEKKTLILDDKQVISFDKVLIATGGQPFIPPCFRDLRADLQNHVMTYRTLADFKKLQKMIGRAKKVAIVGGGFLGTELSYSLKKEKPALEITQVFPEEGNLSLVLPSYLTKWTTKKLTSEGILVKAKSEVVNITRSENDAAVDLLLKNGEILQADLVILSTGLSPNVSLARRSNLEIDPKLNGIVVNAEMEARSDLFAAGDCTSFHDIALGRRRVEHYDHAHQSGKLAGLNMTGAKFPYTHQPMFWSNVGKDVNFEAVGILDSKLQTVSVWSKKEGVDDNEQYNKGVVYYLSKDSQVCGVLLWNTFGKIDKARSIISAKQTVSDPNVLVDLI